MTYQDVFDVELQPGQSVIARLDETGDTKIIWDRANETEVTIAREAFARAKKDRFMAYKVIGDGKKGEIIREFDPTAERIILTPPMQGGA